jgi:hypothetical protein
MKTSVLAALPLVAAMAAAPAAADNLMTGQWYTEGVEHGQHLQSLVANNPNGTFTKNIRNGTDCRQTASWIETGTWTFDGKRYVEVTETVNGQKVDSRLPDYTDTFDVSPVDDTHVALHDAKTLITWPFAKVDPHFALSQPKDCTA